MLLRHYPATWNSFGNGEAEMLRVLVIVVMEVTGAIAMMKSYVSKT